MTVDEDANRWRSVSAPRRTWWRSALPTCESTAIRLRGTPGAPLGSRTVPAGAFGFYLSKCSTWCSVGCLLPTVFDVLRVWDSSTSPTSWHKATKG